MDVAGFLLRLLICTDVCLLAVGKVLKPCRSRSTRCQPAVSAFPTTSATKFRCPAKGHFAVEGDARTYFKCTSAAHEPCRCTCKNEQMCFDLMRHRCRFAFLDSVHNCTRSASLYPSGDVAQPAGTGVFPQVFDGSTSSSAGKPTKGKDVIVHRNSMHTGSGAKDAPAANEVLKARPHPLEENPTTSQQGAALAEFPTNTEAVAFHHAAANEPASTIIEDNSLFPAWAISLLVLCIVIIFVFVVMVLY